jgi:hypothetical protein
LFIFKKIVIFCFSDMSLNFKPTGSAYTKTTYLECKHIHIQNRVFLHSSMALQPFVRPWPLLQFRNLIYTDGRTPWTGNQAVARSLPIHRTTQTQNKRIYRYQCLEWDSNPRSQRPSERRHFML